MLLRLLPVLALVAGCGLGDADPDVTIRLDGAEFMPSAKVVYDIRNNLETQIDLPQCGALLSRELEQFRDGRWENFSATVCPANLMSIPRPLAPGETIRDSVSISTTGQFRLRVRYQIDGGGEFRSATSGSFVIRYPPD